MAARSDLVQCRRMRTTLVLSSPRKLSPDCPVKLVEALEILKKNPTAESPALQVQLACGFTPLHFQTFLGAHLRGAFPAHRVGAFGDLAGNLERLAGLQASTVVAVIEGSDLDPRLGIRILGGWRPNQLGEFLQAARLQAARIRTAFETLAPENTLVVVLPTLPIPPVAFTSGSQASVREYELYSLRASIASKLLQLQSVRVVNPQKLNELSPIWNRFDAKAELNTGFPYSLNHADILARLVTVLVSNPQPKKGLITDLDNTL